MINNLDPKKPDDLPNSLSSFWSERQSQIKQIIEEAPYLIPLIMLEHQNQLVRAIRGIYKRDEKKFHELKSLSNSQKFIHIFGTQLKDALSKYEMLNDCLNIFDGVKLPPELCLEILNHFSDEDLKRLAKDINIG